MDKPTPGYTCAQQKTFGQCSAGFMTQGNYCAQTCGPVQELQRPRLRPLHPWITQVIPTLPSHTVQVT